VNFLFGAYSSRFEYNGNRQIYWERPFASTRGIAAQVSIKRCVVARKQARGCNSPLKKAWSRANSWRAHALLGDADLHLGSSEAAVREAERA